MWWMMSLRVSAALKLPNVLDRRLVAAALSVAALPAEADGPKFRRLSPIQFIAALGDPAASKGTGAESWGLWTTDPGPRGVFLRNYDAKLAATGGKAAAGWQFDPSDWWLEEHGLIMPGPGPLPAGQYVVTGDRKVTTVLTVRPDGAWTLDDGTLYDVTHLPCRSARYKPESGTACTPTSADKSLFPVKPGAEMPPVPGCAKRDYAVLFVVGVAA